MIFLNNNDATDIRIKNKKNIFFIIYFLKTFLDKLAIYGYTLVKHQK